MTLETPGFKDPVIEAQACFRVVLQAMSRPGHICTLTAGVSAPPLHPATAAVLLTLIDAEVALWLDERFASCADWLAFHASARRVPEPAAARFLCTARLPDLAALDPGTDAAPEESATVILQVPCLTGGPPLTVYGPGLEAPISIAPQGLPADFVGQWQRNNALFPRGVDLLLCSGQGFCALPRSLRIGKG